MPDAGVVNGLSAELGWKTFTPSRPILQSFASASFPTQPQLNSASVVAHYFYDRQVGNVIYQGYIQFASDSTFGSGDHVWGLLLPTPALRVLGGADMPIGNAWAWQGSAGNRNIPLRATLMDPLRGGVADGWQGMEDYFAQFFLPYNLATGTATFSSGASTASAAHGLGLTPNAYDITVTPTNAPSTAPGIVYVSSTDGTNISFGVRSSATTTPLTLSWKARCEPNGSAALDLLVNSARPFGGGWASGYLLGWNLEYQARR